VHINALVQQIVFTIAEPKATSRRWRGVDRRVSLRIMHGQPDRIAPGLGPLDPVLEAGVNVQIIPRSQDKDILMPLNSQTSASRYQKNKLGTSSSGSSRGIFANIDPDWRVIVGSDG
jgi:hypothetical protein